MASKVKRGDYRRRTDEELDALALIGEDDVARVNKTWQRRQKKWAKNLLIAGQGGIGNA